MGLLPRRKPKVKRLRRKADVEGLSRASRYEKIKTNRDGEQWDLTVPIRVAAVEGLGECEGPDASAALSQALLDPQPDVRAAAARACGSRATPEMTAALVDCVARWDDPADVEAEEIALDALAGWAQEGLAEAFAERVVEPDLPEPNERHRRALESLLAVDPRGDQTAEAVARHLLVELDVAEPTPARIRSVQAVLGWFGRAAAEPLIESLEQGRGGVAAIGAAGAVGDARAVPALIGLLESAPPEEREAAATTLGMIRDTAAVPALLAGTRDSELGVRRAAGDALDEMGTAAVIVGMAALVEAGRGLALSESETTEAFAMPDLQARLPRSGPRQGGLLERLRHPR